MKTVSALVTVLTIPILLTGCNGPTKTGIEAREEAHARIHTFSAQFTYAQALQDFEAGQFDSALRHIRAAIDENPEAPDFHLLEGRALLESNDLAGAMTSFENAIEVEPSLADAHYYAGVIQQRWSKPELALDYYQHAFDAEPTQVHYLLATGEMLVALGRRDEATTIIRANLAQFEHDPSLLHLLGQIERLNGNLPEAAHLYRQAQLITPDDKRLMEELAWIQFEAGQYKECIGSLDSSGALDGSRIDLMHLRARCLAMTDRQAEAHQAYQNLTRRDPNNPTTWIEFGTLAWRSGDFRRVASCSARTIELAPDRYEGYMLKGLNERHRKNLVEATELFREAAGRCQVSVVPHLLFGQTLEEQGQPEAALEAYRSAIRINPESVEAQTLYQRLEKTMRVASFE